MTTTIGIVYDGGVALGSESRATEGYFIASKEAPKIYKINDKIGMTISGGVADCQQMVKNIRALTNIRRMETGRGVTVKSVAQLTSVILFQNRLTPYISEMIVGGVDDTGPHLYILDPLGSLIPEEHYTATGSGSVVALGVLESQYKDGMSLDSVIKLITTAITASRARDIASGGPLQIIAITKSDGYKKIQ
ncbi:MAG: proteasome subunit beta [Promethearchaeati archaeon SRVP18_Atabeyarchaeia-1]